MEEKFDFLIEIHYDNCESTWIETREFHCTEEDAKKFAKQIDEEPTSIQHNVILYKVEQIDYN